MTFAKVLDDKGLDATSADFGAMFRDSKYALWHANLEGRRALRRGVPAGGTADVYLDGKHTVRPVVRGEPFRDSKGTNISIGDAILFRP